MNLLKVPDQTVMQDLDVLLLSDVLSTAWHATEMGQVGRGDTVAIWGAGCVVLPSWGGIGVIGWGMACDLAKPMTFSIPCTHPPPAGQARGNPRGAVLPASGRGQGDPHRPGACVAGQECASEHGPTLCGLSWQQPSRPPT